MTSSGMLLLLSVVLIISFFYSLLQRSYNISSVILLLISGVILQYVMKHFYGSIELLPSILPVFGTLGLLIIVLEAVLDMDINKSNYKRYINSALLAFLIVLISVLLLTLGFMYSYNLNIIAAIVHAIPLSIVSSAIVIPSLGSVSCDGKQVIVLESIFSDIIGVLLFNFFIVTEIDNVGSIGLFGLSFIFMLIISLLTTLVLAIALSKPNVKNVQVLILAILVFVYTVAKHFHLSALILILIFGLCLRNFPLLMSSKLGSRLFGKILVGDVIHANLYKMKEFVDELGFIIRTFFFVLLGYSINLIILAQWRVILVGVMVVTIIYATRLLVVPHFIDKTTKVLAIVTAPRGLITVLLFFQMPEQFKIKNFDGGMIFFVVIVTSLVMSFFLMRSKYINKERTR